MISALVDWIPKLPAEWRQAPFYTLFKERVAPNTGSTEKNVLSLSYGEIVRRDVESNFGLIPASFDGYNIVEPDDIVMRLTDMQNDQRSLRTGQVRERGIITSAYVTVTPNSQLVPRFAHYLLHGYDLVKVFYRMGGGLRQSMKYGDLKRLPVVVPPPKKQELIATFLDKQTTRIDTLIREKERLIEHLNSYRHSYFSKLMTLGLNDDVELESTSFPEIGDVPKHWHVKRLKFLGEVRSGLAKGKDLGDKDSVVMPYLRVANVQDGYVNLDDVAEMEVAISEVARYSLHKNDVLMNEGGDSDKLGRGAVWGGEIEPCLHQNHVFAVRLADTTLADWVSRFSSTAAARSYFFLRSKQSTNLASISQASVRELPIPMPPPSERKEILSEIEKVSTAVSRLIQHATEHIDKLREYRVSLIYSAVTGQIDVVGG